MRARWVATCLVLGAVLVLTGMWQLRGANVPGRYRWGGEENINICTAAKKMWEYLSKESPNNFLDVETFPHDGLGQPELWMVQVLRMAFNQEDRGIVFGGLYTVLCKEGKLTSEKMWNELNILTGIYLFQRSSMLEKHNVCECPEETWECAMSPDSTSNYGQCPGRSPECFYPVFSQFAGVNCYTNNFFLLMQMISSTGNDFHFFFLNKMMYEIWAKLSTSELPNLQHTTDREDWPVLDHASSAFFKLTIIPHFYVGGKFVHEWDDKVLFEAGSYLINWIARVSSMDFTMATEITPDTFYRYIGYKHIAPLLDTYLLPILQQATYNTGHGMHPQRKVHRKSVPFEEIQANYKQVVLSNYKTIQKMLVEENFKQIPVKALIFHFYSTVANLFLENRFIWEVPTLEPKIVFVVESLYIMMLNIGATSNLPFLSKMEKCQLALFNLADKMNMDVFGAEWTEDDCPYLRMEALVDLPENSPFKNMIVKDVKRRYLLPIESESFKEFKEWDGEIVTDLPASYSFFTSNDKKYLKCMRPPANQSSRCASCWAFATVGSLSHAYCKYLVDTDQAIPFPSQREGRLSVQMVISCIAEEMNRRNIDENNCEKGGEIPRVYAWLTRNKITINACAPYVSDDGDEHPEMCTPLRAEMEKPNTCFRGIMADPKLYFATVREGKYMMQMIYMGGPIVAIMHTPNSFFAHTEGVYNPPVTESVLESVHGSHVIQLSGWGTYDGPDGQKIDYWIGENSWGATYHSFDKIHNAGFFRVARNHPILQIENNMYAWTGPRIPQISPSP